MRAPCVFQSLVVLCLAGAADAGDTFGSIPDVEPANNSAATATTIRFPCNPPEGSCVATGECALGLTDTDHFRFHVNAGDFILAMTIPVAGLPDSFATPDTVLTLLNPGGATVESNDTGGDDFPQPGAIAGSAIQHFASPAGEHVIRVSRSGAGAPGLQSGAALHVAAPQFIPKQPGRDVRVGDRPLVAPVHRQCRGAMLGEDRPDPAAHQIQGLGKRSRTERTASPDQRAGQAITTVQRLNRVVSLDAGVSLTAGRVGIAPRGHRPALLHGNQEPAAYSTELTRNPVPARERRRVLDRRSLRNGDPGHHGGRSGGRHSGGPLEKRPATQCRHDPDARFRKRGTPAFSLVARG